MKNQFDIPYGSIIKDGRERVIMNAMVIDVIGNVATFADLTPVDMAVIQERLGGYGVLLAISEPSQTDASRDGHRVELAFRPTEVTDEQQETLVALANTAVEDGETLSKELAETSRTVLPSLWYSDVAFMPDGLRFRDGNRHPHYTSALGYIIQTVRGAHTQAHRDFNVGLRSHLDQQGFDMSEVPKPELSEQRRQRELDEIGLECNQMLAKAQELQLYSFDLPSPQFVVAVAKAHLAKK